MPGPTIVTISLTDTPRYGKANILTRVSKEDKALVDAACEVLGMRQSEFTRLALVKVAREVMKHK